MPLPPSLESADMVDRSTAATQVAAQLTVEVSFKDRFSLSEPRIRNSLNIQEDAVVRLPTETDDVAFECQ
jgi:hypothetical protein